MLARRVPFPLVAGSLLEEAGEQGCGAGGAPCGDRAVTDRAADLGGDRARAGGGGGGLVVAARPRRVAVEPVADVVVLLEVAGEREIQEGPTAGGQLHCRGQPALDDRQVTGGEVAVQ